MEFLATKFYIPRLRPGAVPRPRLLQRLDEGVHHGRPLTLVSAPAGYGKTTLIAAWLQQTGRREPPVSPSRIAWLSLEEDDDEPARFFCYLGAALENSGADLGTVGQSLQGVSPLPPPDALITNLLNQISQDRDGPPLLLVLDDYHKIDATPIHEALQFMVEHASPHLHLVLITREDPPLTLARWRVRDQMTEIRAGDLRFTEDEATAFLNQTMHLELTAENIAALEVRTEGWIAGLQLAAVALRSPPAGRTERDAAGFIAAFSGSHHYVIDYLLQEVLRRQDEQVRTFLQQTCILERFNPSLCNAVTGRDDSRAILSRLERENLFLIALDPEHHWYRYHHLLADSLRSRIDASLEAELHRRASRWYEAHAFPAEAVRHALATEDLALAADVMERVIQTATAWSRGEVARLTSWLDALPDLLLRARPALSLHASRALYLAGKMNRAQQLLGQAEQALRNGPRDAAERRGLLALASVYQAAIAAMHGERLSEAIAATGRILAEAPTVDLHTAARAADTLGLAHQLRGELHEAERAYLRAARHAESAGVRYLALNARCEAAMVQIEQGQLALATQTCREALELAADEEIAPAGLAWAILGEIARERNELEKAERYLSTGIELSRQGGITDDLRYSFLFLARLKQAQGDPQAALENWRQADLLLQAYNIPRLAALAAAERARLNLAQGNIAQAGHWAHEVRQARASQSSAYLHEQEDLILARFFQADGRPDAALDLLRPILAAARPAGRNRSLIQALILQALALEQQQPAAAVAALREALALATPQGFMRLFNDEGQPIAGLLPRVHSSAPVCVGRILSNLKTDPHTDVVGTIAARRRFTAPPAHIEPLSEREQEVLELLVGGLTNGEIAEELVITVGTTKWHVHNIYQKLDVSSRAEAIARAYAWQLLNA